jgi:hypothetical protein
MFRIKDKTFNQDLLNLKLAIAFIQSMTFRDRQVVLDSNNLQSAVKVHDSIIMLRNSIT